ncbi:MAG TPA: SDR family oxidoreductase [Trueperaceae bacterium]|nr:SDR family oxidoreductase [Trueperaceae bacterium]
MNIVIIGGTGLIGSKLVSKLTERGHQAIAASPDTGVNTLTGAGLAEVLDGADVVVDVSNSPSFEDVAAMEFFTTSTGNLLAAEDSFGVRHHVALSVVGTERLQESGYFRAKLAQERLIRESGIPYTVVRATQFYEFLGRITDAATVAGTVRLQPVYIQPMAADEVAQGVGRAAVGTPVNGIVEIAGPQRYRLDELVRGALGKKGDLREVVTDSQAPYFGVIAMHEDTLLPGADATITETRLEEWVARAAPTAPTRVGAAPMAASGD